MEQGLYRELAEGHPLYGLQVRALGRRQDCDDVLLAVENGKTAPSTAGCLPSVSGYW
jgi:hypothetical protein